MVSRILTAVVAAALPLAAAAQAPATVRVESFALPNGLQVHLVADRSAAVVAVNVWYDVGSRNERPGRTGFAHLFEHMMFQGSANVGKMAHGQLVERAGGSYNGSTAPDRTNYYQVVPSNRINLALWLEADRMRSLAITPENLDNQREAVKEERRLRVDNQPYSGALIDSLPVFFGAERCFAYAHSIIGSMADLEAATVDDVRAFFAQYYAPNNARLVIAGDFDTEMVRRLVREYFGDIPRGTAPPPVDCAPSADIYGARQMRVEDPNATLPAVLMAFRSVPPRHSDYPALVLLATVLGEGESSRLNRTLVRGTRAAVAVQMLHDPFGPMRDAGMFGVLAIANMGVSADSLQTLLTRDLLIAGDVITLADLQKAKNVWRANTIFGRQRAEALAEAVHHAAMFLGSPSAVNTEAARYDEVTLDDLRRVARTYLRPTSSLTLQIVPEAR